MPDHIELQKQLHAKDYAYGQTSLPYQQLVSDICNTTQVQTLLDYGCGRARLFDGLKVDHAMALQAYDPGIARFAERPVPSQMVACIDVLPYVESVDETIADLKRLTLEVLFIAIRTELDTGVFHVKPQEWWLEKLMAHFDLQTFQRIADDRFFAVFYTRPQIAQVN